MKALELQGRTILVSGDNPKVLRLSEFQIDNGSDRGAGPTPIRLYLSKAAAPISPLTMTYPWQLTPTVEVGYPTAFYSTGFPPVIINPTETWIWPAFSAQLNDDLDEISALLRVFYGAAKRQQRRRS